MYRYLIFIFSISFLFTFESSASSGSCKSQYPGSTMMTCMTSFGAMFAINKQSLKFTHAVGLGWVYGTDSVVISYGTCEKF